MGNHRGAKAFFADRLGSVLYVNTALFLYCFDIKNVKIACAMYIAHVHLHTQRKECMI